MNIQFSRKLNFAAHAAK